MRNFVFLDDAPIYGGAERNVLRLARFLGESVPDRSARVICPGDSELACQCRAVGIAVAHARFPANPLRIPGAVLHLRRLLAHVSGDALVVGVSLRSQVYGHAALLARSSAPRIVHYMPEQESARRLTAKLVLRRYGAVVAVGDTAARAYQDLAPEVSVRRVDNFLLLEEFTSAARSAVTGRQQGPPVVGVLTRLFPTKGVLELVEELARNPDAWASLVVVGARQDERYARAVEERVGSLGLASRIRLLGHVGDLASFFGDIDVLVVPSVGAEGQPTVILEALAHGLPVVLRAPMWSSAFEGLAVAAYHDASDLAPALARAASVPISPEELARRFGPATVIEAIEAAAAEH